MSNIKVGDIVALKCGSKYQGRLQNVVTSISYCGDYLRVNGHSSGTYVNRFKVIQRTKHHKFHDLIIAWAKGAEIEFRDLRGLGEWEKVETPSWFNYCAYRIKPSKPTELEKLEAKYKELGDVIKELKDKQ